MIEDSAELDVLIPSAKEICRFYDQSMASNMELKKKLDCSRSKVTGYYVYIFCLYEEKYMCV